MKTKTKIPVLLLCHGRNHTTMPCTPSNDISCCPTSEIDFKDKTLKLTARFLLTLFHKVL